MNKIKFSHKYFKLNYVNQAKLLQVFKCHYNDLSKDFLFYDSLYRKDARGYRLYEFPKDELIILLFQDTFDNDLFTTIRRYTPKKYEYYKSKTGEIFEIVVKEKRK